MEILSQPLAMLIIAAIAMISGGVGFLAKRWLSQTGKHETVAYLNSVMDLAGKLRAADLTIDDVRNLEAVLGSPKRSAKTCDTNPPSDGQAPTLEHEAFQSTLAMRARAIAALGVADAKIGQAIMDLQLLMSDREFEVLKSAQKHWKLYRSELGNLGLLQYEGGTGAPLGLVVAELVEAERRVIELQADLKLRLSRQHDDESSHILKSK
jgi:hypothetical protein